jgi:hypothetical protein
LRVPLSRPLHPEQKKPPAGFPPAKRLWSTVFGLTLHQRVLAGNKKMSFINAGKNSALVKYVNDWSKLLMSDQHSDA